MNKFLTLLLALLAPGCATWRAGTAEKPVVTKVEILGNKRVADSDVTRVIQMQPSGRMPFAAARRFDAELVDADVARILRFYRARGFYETEFEGYRLARGKETPGRARIGFVIHEGKPTHVRTMTINGLDALPEDDRRYVTRRLPLRRGERLIEAEYDLTRDLILERLRERGYAHAEVEGQVEVRPQARAAEVVLAASPGEKYRLGPVVVEGTHATSKRPILMAAALRPGQVFDSRRISDAQGSIYDLGAFRAVAVDLGEPDERDELPVVIRVREAPPQAFEFGVGGGVETTMQRVRNRVTWRHRNLFGGMDQVEATLRIGYAVLPNIVDPVRDGPIWGGEVRFRRPIFFARSRSRPAAGLLDRKMVLASRFVLEHQLQEAYTEDSVRGTVGVERPIGELDTALAYGVHLYRLTALRTEPGTTAEQSPRASPDRCPTPCTISFIEPRLFWDRRDDVVEPANGWYAGGVFEKGGGFLLGGTHEYWRASPEFRAYLTPFRMQRRITFAARAETGWIFPENGPSPVVRRFYSGGPDSHRGYGTHRLSPMVQRKGGGTVPIGGDTLFEASFESRIWLGQKIVAVGFVDAGSVEFRRTTFNSDRVAWAIGPGLRYLTPIGPVRLDVGFRLNDPKQYALDAPGERVREPRWAFHIGLGEAF